MSRRLGQILIEAKVIQPEQFEQALKLQGPIPQSLEQLLVSQGLATEEQIATALATQLPYVRQTPSARRLSRAQSNERIPYTKVAPPPI